MDKVSILIKFVYNKLSYIEQADTRWEILTPLFYVEKNVYNFYNFDQW